MSSFNEAIDYALADEGGDLVLDDHGRGPSRWGITLATAQAYPASANWTAETIRNLTRDQAVTWYQIAFWDFYHIGLIDNQPLANKVFDLCINTNACDVIHVLQKMAGVVQDCIVGPLTARSVNAIPPVTALIQFKQMMIALYKDIEAKHPQWSNNFAGWEARVNK